MPARTYIVTWVTADGQTKTEGVIGRNHLAVERFIKKQGGKVIHLDRDEVMSRKSHAFRHDVWGVVLFVVIAVVVVAYLWYRRR